MLSRKWFWRSFEHAIVRGKKLHNISILFAGGFGKQRETKVRDTIHQLSVPLEKFYNGYTFNIEIDDREIH
jgi:hypothetical protein